MSGRPEFTSVGVVGTGTIGASWAACYALGGLEVRLYDAAPAALDGGLRAAAAFLDQHAELGLAGRARADEAAARLRRADSLEAMAEGAGFVQESVRETLEAKQEVFGRLDACLPPGTPIASSTSGLLMTDIQRGLRRPERTLIAHPFNPPHLIPLVELVGGERTAPETLDRARRFFEALGKTPVTLRREVPGHIANRLAAALWREAIDLVASGAASVEDVDKALSAGPGLRWAVMGQHMIYHLGGGAGGYRHFIDHIGSSFGAYWRGMADWTAIPPEAREQVIAGVERSAAGRTPAELARGRDRRLAAVLKALADLPAEV